MEFWPDVGGQSVSVLVLVSAMTGRGERGGEKRGKRDLRERGKTAQIPLVSQIFIYGL